METITIKPPDNTGKQRVLLSLPSLRVKYIGYILNRTFYTVRNPEKHLHKKSNSLGMNYKLISLGTEYFDFISIQYGFNKLETSREYFLKNGSFLHFKKNGFEKQLFLPLSQFGMDKVKEFDRQQVEILKEKFEGYKNSVLNLHGQLNIFQT